MGRPDGIPEIKPGGNRRPRRRIHDISDETVFGVEVQPVRIRKVVQIMVQLRSAFVVFVTAGGTVPVSYRFSARLARCRDFRTPAGIVRERNLHRMPRVPLLVPPDKESRAPVRKQGGPYGISEACQGHLAAGSVAVGGVKICRRRIIAGGAAFQSRPQCLHQKIVVRIFRAVELHVEIGRVHVRRIFIGEEEDVLPAGENVRRKERQVLHLVRREKPVGLVALPAGPVKIRPEEGRPAAARERSPVAIRPRPENRLVRMVETDRPVDQVVHAERRVPVGVGDGQDNVKIDIAIPFSVRRM